MFIPVCFLFLAFPVLLVFTLLYARGHGQAPSCMPVCAGVCMSIADDSSGTQRCCKSYGGNGSSEGDKQDERLLVVDKLERAVL